ncbi:MAG: phosphotransferase, partial [Myxococcales bacterium]|nr:phosphotransferase [Myxococcales bacterium]
MAPAPPLAAAPLRQVLRAHGLAPAGPVPVPPREVTPRVLAVETTAGPVAVKVFAPDQRAQAQAECAMLLHLRGHGAGDYRVQQLVMPRSSPPPLVLAGHAVLVTRWEPGEHRPYQAIDAAGWLALGRSLAALHRRLDDHPGHGLPDLLDALRAVDPDRERATLEAHRRRATAHQAPGAAAVLELLAERAALFDQRGPRALGAIPHVDPRPIHNDYNVHNYLFSPGEPPLILDWERAGRAPRELEVCRCLAHLPIVAPDHAQAFVDGYLAVRALDPALVRWAAEAAACAHALKHWPVELWLAGAPGAAARVEAMVEIPRALVREAATFD